MDLALYKGVLCYAEQRHELLQSTTYELLGIGRKLADDLKEELCAVLIGYKVSESAQDLIERGADKVYILDDPMFENFIDETYASALVDLIQKAKPNKFLIAASTIGRSLGIRIAVLAGTGIVPDATELSIDPASKGMIATRPFFGGNILATMVDEKHRPEIATVRPMTFARAEKTAGRQGKIEKVAVDASKWNVRTKFVSYVPEKSEVLDISGAERIVSGGRGLGKPEGFKLIEELAGLLNAAVGASRAVVDAGWIPYRHQVGLTGRTVRPKLYIACGISGAIQHLAGMSSSDFIIAINNDPKSTMMQLANISVEGDLYELLPAIIKEIKAVKG